MSLFHDFITGAIGPQEYVDKTHALVIEQGAPSYDPAAGGCLYVSRRGRDADSCLHCAIGLGLSATEKVIAEDVNSGGVVDLIAALGYYPRLKDDRRISLMLDLQCCHDAAAVGWSMEPRGYKEEPKDGSGMHPRQRRTDSFLDQWRINLAKLCSVYALDNPAETEAA